MVDQIITICCSQILMLMIMARILCCWWGLNPQKKCFFRNDRLEFWPSHEETKRIKGSACCTSSFSLFNPECVDLWISTCNCCNPISKQGTTKQTNGASGKIPTCSRLSNKIQRNDVNSSDQTQKQIYDPDVFISVVCFRNQNTSTSQASCQKKHWTTPSTNTIEQHWTSAKFYTTCVMETWVYPHMQLFLELR